MNLNLKTYDKDNRIQVGKIYKSYSKLGKNWIKEPIAFSKHERNGKVLKLPILSFRTKKKGKAIWIIAGIHGEEPAGVNAVSEGIKYIAEIGKEIPVVLLPLCNPLGYVSDWRYLNIPVWSRDLEGFSVGDSEYLLPSLKNKKKARGKSTSPEEKALTKYVMKLEKQYPPFLTIDFHEDNLVNKGYVYSQGKYGAEDKIAKRIVKILASKGVPIKMHGLTRFGQKIFHGNVKAKHDGSIDEFLSAKKIIVNGRVVVKPNATTAIVVETPAANMKLEKRKNAHLEVLKRLKEVVKMKG